ncbi:MAG TPA: tetratricopeptide repeat protein [Candidatus Binataceae bacterium]|nr:tetratricopeptide repeat protein [Candidatus Binataceae bacterium]
MRFSTLFLAASLLASAAGADLERARQLYEITDYEGSLRLLQAMPAKDGSVYELMGRDYLMSGDFKKATVVLEKAVAADPNNSEYALWLGRAYGRRAETSNFITAIGYGSKARQYFERAAQLNPRNIEALNDLLEFQMEAPGFMGGGLDKAKATIARIAQVNPSEGQWAQSTLDERRKEYGSAEEHLRRALELAPQQVGRLADLARFLYKQGRYQEGDQTFARAEQLAPDNAKLLYVRAESYIKSGRNLKVARDLLERYLGATTSPEDPPKDGARKLLRQIEGS